MNVLGQKVLNGINLIQWVMEGCEEQEPQKTFHQGVASEGHSERSSNRQSSDLQESRQKIGKGGRK